MNQNLFFQKKEFKLSGVFIKGKNGKEYRFLIRNLSTNELFLFWIDKESHFCLYFGANFTFIPSPKMISSTHLKFKNYNYYFLNNDSEILKQELEWFKQNRKVSPQGNGIFSKGYIPSTFLFEGITY